MKVARFRFDASLRELLQHEHNNGEFDYAFRGPQTAKHLIESAGIPHTEIGSVRAGAAEVGTGYQVSDKDIVDVSAYGPDPETGAEPRFVLDGHLGRLKSHLRMLGYDCLYETSYDDEQLLQLALAEDRVLLTRDRRLLMHKALQRGYLVRSLEPMQQFQEVVRRYSLIRWIRPFQRCIRCNHLLEPVEKQVIIDRLEPLTKLYFDEFHICPACRRIYWKGSHFEKMERMIAALQE
ncbi:MAG TPA: Mut7-C RNAse domain-containing protein [Anaerolineales bacterium]|nr:Mut7-C RNAse domain-containing protein [Anaerolineales bacterium]